MPQTLRLYYFDIRGLAESTRMLLNYRGVAFEDVRYEFGKFPKEKFNFGRLPVLEIDGKQLAENCAILMHLARQHDLGGKTDFDTAEINAIGLLYQDFVRECVLYLQISTGRREGDKEKAYKENVVPALETYVPLFERQLAKAGNGYLHPSGISWVDFVAATIIYTCRNHLNDFKKSKPLNDHCDRIHALPELKTYLANRKQTDV